MKRERERERERERQGERWREREKGGKTLSSSSPMCTRTYGSEVPPRSCAQGRVQGLESQYTHMFHDCVETYHTIRVGCSALSLNAVSRTSLGFRVHMFRGGNMLFGEPGHVQGLYRRVQKFVPARPRTGVFFQKKNHAADRPDPAVRSRYLCVSVKP